jgi:hypothetical protein
MSELLRYTLGGPKVLFTGQNGLFKGSSFQTSQSSLYMTTVL